MCGLLPSDRCEHRLHKRPASWDAGSKEELAASIDVGTNPAATASQPLRDRRHSPSPAHGDRPTDGRAWFGPSCPRQHGEAATDMRHLSTESSCGSSVLRTTRALFTTSGTIESAGAASCSSVHLPRNSPALKLVDRREYRVPGFGTKLPFRKLGRTRQHRPTHVGCSRCLRARWAPFFYFFAGRWPLAVGQGGQTPPRGREQACRSRRRWGSAR